MKFKMICAAVLVAALSGCATPMPPYTPQAAARDAWGDCQNKAVHAYLAAMKDSGGATVAGLAGPVGALAGNAMTNFDNTTFTLKCMADKGFSLPPGYTVPPDARF